MTPAKLLKIDNSINNKRSDMLQLARAYKRRSKHTSVAKPQGTSEMTAEKAWACFRKICDHMRAERLARAEKLADVGEEMQVGHGRALRSTLY